SDPGPAARNGCQEMTASRFEQLLDRAIGLNPLSVGSSAIERAVERRIKACDLADADAYWELVQQSHDELQELIEAVVVPETWFFRDPPAFAAMVRFVSERATHDRSRPQRLLSLPCSTGEEPYTMAMALLDAGVAPGCFRIDAVDVSARSILRAQ